ncbi:MAG: histidinol dehydrogenase [Clostridia bacterium]|nr:histidinol dehydrogenase [Clostridia bacterium]
MIRIYESKELYLKQKKLNTFDLWQYEKEVKGIIQNVDLNGDEALKLYTKQWDLCKLDALRVSEEEIQEAFKLIPDPLLKALKNAKDNIEAYHKLQMPRGALIEKDNCFLKERISPLQSVGIYVPGGKAAYPSTVLMNGIPGKIAGVKRLVMVSPPNAEGKLKPSVLVAASLVGIHEIYKVGGAQSIAALALGTETISPVKKIVGPGNAYVALAKKILSEKVGIDMIAGPSEIMILADDSANPEFVAADMIAQAEHDENATSLLVSSSEALLNQVKEAIMKQVERHQRKEIIIKSFTNQGALVYVENVKDMIELANDIAPEHLEIMMLNADKIAEEVESAGAIFLGNYTPEALGDYYAGPNHTLPTSGTAKFSSPLNVMDFMKRTSIIKYTKEKLLEASGDIITIALDEGLYGHGEAIRIRRK